MVVADNGERPAKWARHDAAVDGEQDRMESLRYILFTRFLSEGGRHLVSHVPCLPVLALPSLHAPG